MITVYKDGAEIAKTASKREANRIIRDTYTPGVKYAIDEGNGIEKLSVTKRSDGRISINYLSATSEWLKQAKKDGTQRTVSVVMSNRDYTQIEAAAAKSGMTVWSWAKTVLIEAAKK